MLPLAASLVLNLVLVPVSGASVPEPTSPPAAAVDARVRIETSPIVGLGPEAGIGRRDASDVIRIGELDLVLYTRLSADTPLYPAPYTGEIWYATSEDAGHTWTERGRLLGHGPAGAFDAVGVFEPNVLRTADGGLWLYYSGVGPQFNFRFESQRRVEPVRIGVARLFVNELSGEARAARGQGGRPVLEPSPRAERDFDSLRVCGAAPILRNGLVSLYYAARQYGRPGATSTLGLTRAQDGAGPFERAHEGRAVLPFSGDAVLHAWRGGVLALLTTRERGLYWAADGEHFARLSVRVLGRLSAPGVLRDEPGSGSMAPEADAAPAPHTVWGLHTGGERPDPYLERFEYELSPEFADPPRPLQAIPSSHRAAHWTAGSTWLAQHRQSLESAAARPRHYVFLGDGLTEGFGGHERASAAPGAEIWQQTFAGKEVLNLGIAGDRTEHLLWRLDHGALERARCRAVVLQVGGNNLGEDEPADVALAVESMLRRIQHGLPFTEVVLLSIPARPADDAERVARIRGYNQRLSRLARWPRVSFLDLARELRDAEGRPRPEYFGDDGPFLTRAGYEKWASALGPLLDSIEEPVPEGAAQMLDELDRDD